MNQRAVDISKEHAIEMYKSMISIAMEGLKLLALLNGGSAVALLAYLGNVAGKSAHGIDMRLPMFCYVAGLVFCGLAYFVSYLTQLRLFNESLGRVAASPPHTRLLYSAMILDLLSLAAFAAGSVIAAYRFT